MRAARARRDVGPQARLGLDVLADGGERDALRESGPRSWRGSEPARGPTCWPGEPRSRWGHRGHIRYFSPRRKFDIVMALLAKGVDILKVAKSLGIGTGTYGYRRKTKPRPTKSTSYAGRQNAPAGRLRRSTRITASVALRAAMAGRPSMLCAGTRPSANST